MRAGQSWVQFVRRAKAHELPVVLLEDVAALIGLLLVVVPLVLGVETKSLLLGEGAGATEVSLIEAAILDGGEVGRILHMKSLYLEPDLDRSREGSPPLTDRL